jgi:hypothetical protein
MAQTFANMQPHRRPKRYSRAVVRSRKDVPIQPATAAPPARTLVDRGKGSPANHRRNPVIIKATAIARPPISAEPTSQGCGCRAAKKTLIPKQASPRSAEIGTAKRGQARSSRGDAEEPSVIAGVYWTAANGVRPPCRSSAATIGSRQPRSPTEAKRVPTVASRETRRTIQPRHLIQDSSRPRGAATANQRLDDRGQVAAPHHPTSGIPASASGLPIDLGRPRSTTSAKWRP